jgi:endonuclease I
MRRLRFLVVALAFIFAGGCSSSTSDSASSPGQEETTDQGPQNESDEPGQEDESDESQQQQDDNPEEEDDTNPNDDVSNPDGSEGDNPDENNESSGGIPDEFSTNGGRSFSGTIQPDEEISITLQANQGDFIVARLESTGEAQWTPGLEISRDGESIAWHEAEQGGVAHIPYEDQNLDQGWEVYEDGAHTLTLQNISASAGDFTFELNCKSGPCLNQSDDSGGSDDDGDTGNDDNNQAGDCPTATGSQLEQMLRDNYSPTSSVDYDRARERMWRSIYNENGTVEGVYTGETIRTNTIPDPEEFNTEHGVPRSKIEGEGPAFSDIHHLYPSESQANAKRSNLPFDDVTGRSEWSSSGSKRGPNENGTKVFEPRDVRKGDLARSVFYFAVIYDRDIDISAERDGWGIGLADEDTLRRWHNEVDPVSSGERSRNQAISDVQGNINPFIKCPGLVSQINDF